MKKIRILVDGHILDGERQGTCSYIAGLYAELAKKEQCKIFVATAKQESIIKYFGRDSNINWVPLTSKNKYQRLAVEFDQIAKDIKPDYSHFQYITPLRKRNKWINTIHDILFLDFPEDFPLSYRIKNYLLFRLGAIRSDVLFTVSQYSKQRISHHFKIAKEAILVTPNAINDIARVEASPIKQLVNKEYFVYVSRFEPRKNQHKLIEAFYQANLGDDVKLVLVGAPALAYRELDAQLKSNRNNQLLHLQDIKKSELVWLYKNAVAAFYPSKCEGFGIPPLEAVALGCPSYCADNTALSELKKYVSGTFENEVNAMTQLMKKVYSEKDTLKGLVKSNAVLNDFNWSNSADILLETLKMNN